jgi:hypothetical protein
MIKLLAEYKSYKILGGKREFLSREILTFCFSPNSIRLVKSDRMRLARHVARIIGMRNSYRIPATNSQGQTHIWRPRFGFNVNVIMNCKAWGGMMWKGFIRPTLGVVTGYRQYCIESLNSM